MIRTFFICLFSVAIASLHAQSKTAVPEIGVVNDIENDSLLHAFGYRYVVESTNKILSPRKVSDQQFTDQLQIIKKLRVPLFATNLFIPGDLKVVGPNVNEQAVLTYVEIVLQRAQEANLKMIIWGSGGSRGVPEGFDRAKAKDQFISIAKKIATLAEKHNITLALENLNRTECNFINSVTEALEIVKAVDHKNLRLCIDLYHMAKEGESPDVIATTKKYVLYCEVAEKENRTPPGVHGDDFTPYFTALKKINYAGKIVIECRWENIATQGSSAYQALRNQLYKVYEN
ncbi:MAG: sugar phosphate isomerase/epimerase family protein [Chryseolinea sp.]